MSGANISGPSDPPSDFTDWHDEDIIEAMVTWFHENFEDPAHNTPHESREGGYIYIWGGPYDAREELEGSFSSVDEALIERAVDEVEQDGTFNWAPNSNRQYEEHYDEEEFEDSLTYLKNTASELELIIKQIPFKPVGVGHNMPPEAIDDLPLDADDKQALLSATAAIKEFEDTPKAAEASAQEISKLQTISTKIVTWLAHKLDMAVDAFIKAFAAEFGKATAKLGKWFILYQMITSTIEAHSSWISSLF